MRVATTYPERIYTYYTHGWPLHAVSRLHASYQCGKAATR